jgi:hypothetical protein
MSPFSSRFPSLSVRRAVARAALLLAFAALAACGNDDAAPPAKPTEADLLASGYTQMNGYLVPPRELADPTLPDTCVLLTESDPGPKEMITEPLAPIERMGHVCIATIASKYGYDLSIAVEIRHPETFEVEAGLPKDMESFWMAEGGGIDLLGGRREQVEPIEGLGELAMWYPITGGIGLHAYSQGSRYIHRVTIRGIDKERSLAWAKAFAQRAIEASAALGQSPVTPAQ